MEKYRITLSVEVYASTPTAALGLAQAIAREADPILDRVDTPKAYPTGSAKFVARQAKVR